MKLPKVTLLSWPMFPIETVYSLWQASRNNGALREPKDIHADMLRNPDFDMRVRNLFTDVCLSGIPVGESLTFVFMLENVTVSFREQMVRHRIGMKFGDRLGVDIVPDLASSTWWSQTSRVLDQREFAKEERYTLPESLRGKKMNENLAHMDAEDFYIDHMKTAAAVYRRLIDSGVPIEDAREVLPFGIQHRLSWALNLSAIKHVVGKRSCWVAQSGHWFPVIKGMIEELCTKVDPIFRRLVDPPCFKKGEWVGCQVPFEEMRNRIQGSDEIPPCPLFLNHHQPDADRMSHCAEEPAWVNLQGNWVSKDVNRNRRMIQMKETYGELWNRDTSTGDPK